MKVSSLCPPIFLSFRKKHYQLIFFQAFPLLLADIDPSGNMNAQIIHGPTDRTRLKFMSQIVKKKWEGVQMSADYKGDTWTSSLTLANPDIVNGSGVGVLHYLKSVSSFSSKSINICKTLRKYLSWYVKQKRSCGRGVGQNLACQ